MSSVMDEIEADIKSELDRLSEPAKHAIEMAIVQTVQHTLMIVSELVAASAQKTIIEIHKSELPRT